MNKEIFLKLIWKEFDVIISLFHVFSYQTSNSIVLKLLSNAYTS